MKKVFSVLAALAAVAGSAYLLYRKFGKRAMVVSEEFDDEETIVMEELSEEETEEAPAE